MECHTSLHQITSNSSTDLLITFFNNICFVRVKDNKIVFCVLQQVIGSSLKKAQELGITIHHIIHKVGFEIFENGLLYHFNQILNASYFADR